MRVVISWLREYVDLDGVTVEDLAERWTLAGLEVESIEHIGDWWDRERLIVGAITRIEPHPNADRLVLADVDYGAGETHRIVTGAPNLLPLRETGDLERPMKVVFAREGVELFDGYAEGWVKTVLKGRKVRGVMSDAMACSEKELGLSDDHTGILVLDDDAPVGSPLADVLGDAVVTLDLTPNFARAMNMIGVARETAAILGRPFRAPEPAVEATGSDVNDLAEVVIMDPDLCPRYSARVIRDLTIGPSPTWMARRLTMAGMRPINNVVDITNYVMLEWGEPLHAFDYDALAKRAGGGPPTIIVRRALPGERMTTLDDVHRPLDADTLMIADKAGPLAIAGVMGGAETEVGQSTRNVLLEAAAFDFISIRRTSTAQKLPSESSARFGRGVHPALVAPASIRAAELMRQLAGGEVAKGVVDAYPRPPEPEVVTLPAGEVRRLLGVDVPLEETVAILERLEFEVERLPDGALRATVPADRMDVAIPADLVEEVARIYGYDRLPATRMADPLPEQRDNPALRLEELTRDTLAAAGLQEAISYHLLDADHEAKLTAEPQPAAEGHLGLSNPISPERSSLRRSILTGLLDAARSNLRFTNRIALFEVGPVYYARPDDLPQEPRRVGLVLIGPVREQSWRGGRGRSMDFHDAKGVVETLLAALGIEAEWRPGAHPSTHPSRTAAIEAGGCLLGHVGELHPQVRERWELGEQPVAVADLDLDALGGLAGGWPSFSPFSVYPGVHEDLAVVVDEAVPAAEVAAVIRRAGGTLLVDLDLFDVYRGAQVGTGKKSLAWSLTFQASDKTLTSEATGAVRNRIVKALEKELAAGIRSQ